MLGYITGTGVRRVAFPIPIVYSAGTAALAGGARLLRRGAVCSRLVKKSFHEMKGDRDGKSAKRSATRSCL